MRITQYIRDTQAEMAHVNWPSRDTTIRFTIAVIAVSLAVAIMLGVADFVFTRLLTLIF